MESLIFGPKSFERGGEGSTWLVKAPWKMWTIERVRRLLAPSTNWKSKVFIYIQVLCSVSHTHTHITSHITMDKVLSFHRAKKRPLKNTHVIGFNWILCQISSHCRFTQITHGTCHRRGRKKSEKLFLQLFISSFMLFSVEMENLRNDLWDLLRLIIKVSCSFHVRKLGIFRMITYWIFKPHLKHINFNDCWNLRAKRRETRKYRFSFGKSRRKT